MSADFLNGAKASDQMSPYDDGVGDGVTLRHWSSILSFCTVAVVAGLVAGLFGALFRLALGWADGARIALVEFAHQALPAGWLVAVALGAATAAAAAIAGPTVCAGNRGGCTGCRTVGRKRPPGSDAIFGAARQLRGWSVGGRRRSRSWVRRHRSFRWAKSLVGGSPRRRTCRPRK